MKIRVVSTISAAVIALVGQTFAADAPKSAAISTNKPVTAVSTNKPALVAVPAPVVDEAVARVNGTEIKRKELNNAVQAYSYQLSRQGRRLAPAQVSQLQQDVLEELIGRELLLQEGTKHPPADIDKKVQEQVDQTKTKLGGEQEFKKTLADTGTTAEEYTQHVRDNVIIRATIEAAVSNKVTITPQDTKTFYDANPDQFKQPELVRASHILVRCAPDATDDVKKAKRAQIEAARSLIKGGDKFADVAKKVSEDPGSTENGGDLGYFGRGQMVPEFDAAAFSLKTNEVSDVITTRFGYHVLMVTARKPARTLPYDEVQDEITQFLKQRKGNEVTRAYVTGLRTAAKVEVLLPPPATTPSLQVPSVETAPVKAPSPGK